jgi:hypothetical protein
MSSQVQPLNSFVVPAAAPASLDRGSSAAAPASQQGLAAGGSRRGLVVALLVALFFVLAASFAIHSRGASRPPAPPASLAGRLYDGGWVLYTSPACSYCASQLSALGGQYRGMVVCGGAGGGRGLGGGVPLPGCDQVPAYPYWVNVNTRETRTGVQSQSELAAMARAR